MFDHKIFCAADTTDIQSAMSLAKTVESAGAGLKLGLEFFNSHGPRGVAEVQNYAPNLPIFLDLKYYDIPNTVKGAVASVLANVTPAYLNVHASGGLPMMEAAREACGDKTKLLAVTILTSFDQAAFSQAGYSGEISERVEAQAKLAKQAGMDGIVCSPLEIDLVRKACGNDFALMVPGIRPTGSDKGDQKRVMTPKEAIDAGATHLVIGRPITSAKDPAQAIRDIQATL